MKEDFKITFWGVRGSHPVPGKDTLYFGGNTTCVEITAGGRRIIIDAGTGIIGLGQSILKEYLNNPGKKPLELTILFTHLHHDHTQGLPFFAPLFLGQSIIHFFGPLNFDNELKLVLERSMTPPNFPINFFQTNSIKEITTLKESHIILIEKDDAKPVLKNRFLDKPIIKDTTIVIKIMNDYSHPANGVFIYKIEYRGKSIVFATDVEGYIMGNSKLINFALNADILIHDAQYTKEQYTGLPTPRQGFGHSIPEMAIEVGRAASVKNLVLTHHDPSAKDGELKRKQSLYRRRFKNLIYAKEGLTLKIE